MRKFVLALAAFTLLGSSSAWAEGEACGGFAGQGCADGEYCSYGIDQACGAGDQKGVCKVKPEICNKIYMPVCGCDSVTYGNACEAAANGASVAHPGACMTANLYVCPEVISCGVKDGKVKEYPTPCAATLDGATNIMPKMGDSCPAFE